MTYHPLEPLSWYGYGQTSDDYAVTPPEVTEDAATRPEWKRELRAERGLVAGRFLPVHRGHQYLIDFALAGCMELVIAVRKQAGDVIDARQRVEWLRELYPQCRVIDDEQYGPIRAVFSSEKSHQELASRLGAQLVLCDPQRRVVPISGSRVREAPLRHWRYLPDCVRPYYLKVVRVVGAEGSGKTTLCEKLAAQFDTLVVPEFAVELAEANGGKLDKGQLIDWAQRHLATRQAMERQANRLLILDTDLLTVALWGERLYGEAPPWIRRRKMHYDETLMLEPVLEGLSPSLVRERQEMFDKWSGTAGVRIKGDWESRERQAVAALCSRWPDLV